MKRLAIFDFDGTITSKDSLLEFIKFYRGEYKFYFGLVLLSPVLALYAFKIIPNWRAKEIVLDYFFGNEKEDVFSFKCEVFAKSKLPFLVKSSALEAIKKHQLNGDRIVVISASAEHWLSFWCQEHNLELIATQLEVKDKKITGRIKGFNCYGEEKRCRLDAFLDIKKYDEIHVYGDSKGDKAILEIATHPYYRHFH